MGVSLQSCGIPSRHRLGHHWVTGGTMTRWKAPHQDGKPESTRGTVATVAPSRVAVGHHSLAPEPRPKKRNIFGIATPKKDAANGYSVYSNPQKAEQIKSYKMCRDNLLFLFWGFE